MPSKFDRCLHHVRASNALRNTNYNEYAVCQTTVGRYGVPTGGQRRRSPRARPGYKVYIGPRGGRYRIIRGRKVYMSK
jgi:hypothetical protein